MPFGTASPGGLALVLLGPPILVFLFWYVRRRWTLYQKFGEITGADKKKHLIEASLLLAGMYVFGFAILYYLIPL